MWKVLCFYEKVHNLANFGGFTTILFELSVKRNRMNALLNDTCWAEATSNSKKIKPIAALAIIYACISQSVRQKIPL